MSRSFYVALPGRKATSEVSLPRRPALYHCIVVWHYVVLLATSSVLFGEDRPHQSTGYKTTAIPIVNFSSDDGTGYGVRAYLFDYDGSSIPYRRQYSLQAFFTTGGKWVHRALIDAL